MKMRTLVLELAICLATGMAPSTLSAQAQTGCEVTTAEKAEIIEAARTMYAAATTDDLGKFHSVTTSDFYAFDNGKQFVGDEIMALVKKFHAAGTVFVWSVTQPKVHACGDVAWVSYINEGSMTDAAGTITKLTWLESMGLVKEKMGWRIQFLNSSRMTQ